MHIIKLNAIDSTNSFLKQLSNEKALEDYTIAITNNQTKGKGQIGNSWQSEKGKNLTFSIFKTINNLALNEQFYLSILTSLALVRTLKRFDIPKLSIKWPNDILSEKKKICGILIENSIKQDSIQSTVIGIGLNVNQTVFHNLPRASSLKLITGTNYNLNELLNLFLNDLKYYFNILDTGKRQELYTAYNNYLFRKDKPSTFRDCKNSALFPAYIKSVGKTGQLILELEDYIEKHYNLKEIELLY